jgi:hypothetical protein
MRLVPGVGPGVINLTRYVAYYTLLYSDRATFEPRFEPPGPSRICISAPRGGAGRSVRRVAGPGAGPPALPLRPRKWLSARASAVAYAARARASAVEWVVGTVYGRAMARAMARSLARSNQQCSLVDKASKVRKAVFSPYSIGVEKR